MSCQLVSASHVVRVPRPPLPPCMPDLAAAAQPPRLRASDAAAHCTAMHESVLLGLECSVTCGVQEQDYRIGRDKGAHTGVRGTGYGDRDVGCGLQAVRSCVHALSLACIAVGGATIPFLRFPVPPYHQAERASAHCRSSAVASVAQFCVARRAARQAHRRMATQQRARGLFCPLRRSELRLLSLAHTC